MLHINHCNTLQNRAVPTNGPVLYSTLYEDKGNGNRDGKERGHIQPLADRELQGKVGKRFLSDGKVRPQAVSEKIILAALRYFSRKPCLSGSICRWALVVQRAAKARVSTIKMIKL